MNWSATLVGSGLLVAASIAFGGCMTGERPTVTDSSASAQVTDPAVARVLDLLESDPTHRDPFKARYDVLRKFGNTRVEAVLAHDGDRWSLTVGDVRYLDVDGDRSTCDLTTGRCVDGFDEARVSDALTTVGFSRRSAAVRLRRDADTATGPADTSVQTVAGRPSTCAALPQPGGTSLYCADDLGILAVQDTADVRIALVELDERVDPHLFATTDPRG